MILTQTNNHPNGIDPHRSFRLKLNEDAMATEKLAEGIASFSQAIVKVEKIITDKIAASSA